jgi:hypothetical protein
MSTLSFPWRLLGELLLEKELVRADVLDQALEEQQRTGRRLGEILVENGTLDAEQLSDLLAEQHGLDLTPFPPTKTETLAVDEWQPLGRLLVLQGSITEAVLETALATQRASGRRLGDVLLGDHGVSMLALASALSAQHGVPVGGGQRGARDATASDVRYHVAEPDGPTLFMTDSFLEATDFAFEYVEANAPGVLQIVRAEHGESAPVWSYDRSAVGEEDVDLVQVYGFRPNAWNVPPRHTA